MSVETCYGRAPSGVNTAALTLYTTPQVWSLRPDCRTWRRSRTKPNSLLYRVLQSRCSRLVECAVKTPVLTLLNAFDIRRTSKSKPCGMPLNVIFGRRFCPFRFMNLRYSRACMHLAAFVKLPHGQTFGSVFLVSLSLLQN